MNKKNLSSKMALLAATSLLSAGAIAADKKNGDIKCYGVATAGKNACGSTCNKHACQGNASANYSPYDWKYDSPKECAKMGGIPGKEPKCESMGPPNTDRSMPVNGHGHKSIDGMHKQ